MESRRSITRWNNNEEILLAESWIELSQDVNIRKDQHDDIYWNLILSDFNSRTTAPPRTKNLVMGKWTRMHDNLQELFGPDPRERPAGKQRAPEKQKWDYRRKCDAAEKVYGAKREKELAIMQCKELEFLMINISALPQAKRAIIERKQAEIMRKYPDA
nr:glutathione S-transferase T3-like [Tanacetum cinerariifolium]